MSFSIAQDVLGIANNPAHVCKVPMKAWTDAAGAGMFAGFTADDLYKRYHQLRRVSLHEEQTGLLQVGPLYIKRAECLFSIDQDDSILDIANNPAYVSNVPGKAWTDAAGAGLFAGFAADDLYKRYHELRSASRQEEHASLLQVGPLCKRAECLFSIDQDDSILDIANNPAYVSNVPGKAWTDAAGGGMFLDFTADDLYKLFSYRWWQYAKEAQSQKDKKQAKG